MRQSTLKGLIAGVGLIGAGAIWLGLTQSRKPTTPSPPTPKTQQSPIDKPSVPAPQPSTPQAEKVPAMSLSQAVGQRIIYSYEGYAPPERLRELIQRGEAGGIIIFKRNVKSPSALAATMEDLQAIPRPAGLEAPLLIMIDQEGGRVKRLPGPPEHSPREIGNKGSTQLAHQEGIATGRYLKSHGVNVNLAPLVDVARPGTYQERSSRSYSRSTDVVANMAGAFAKGLSEEDVVPCFKHFPGLGGAFTNEDLKVNRIDIALPELNRVDLSPFKRATQNSMVMTSTAIYPALDNVPALFSRKIVTGELRNKIGFKGLSITDDLEVPALQEYGNTTERGRKAIEAGNDLLLYCVSFRATEKALRGLTELYKNKKLDQDQLYQTTARVLEFRTRLKGETVPKE